MRATLAEIPEIKIFELPRHRDRRGFLSEIFRQSGYPGINFVQDNLSHSVDAGTLRGLHFQEPPFAQSKLLTVLAGAIFDVAIDLRLGAPTYGKWIGTEIHAEDATQIYIPQGFAHGFCTLVPQTTVLYKVDAYYSASHERGIRWNDAGFKIDWPIGLGKMVISDKDRNLPLLGEITTPFHY